MLRLSLLFLILAVVAGLFGYAGLSVAFAGTAKLLFFIFLVIFIVLLIWGLMASRGPREPL